MKQSTVNVIIILGCVVLISLITAMIILPPKKSQSANTGLNNKTKTCPQNCSGNGTCDSKTGVCTCNTGYSGNDCASTNYMFQGPWISPPVAAEDVYKLKDDTLVAGVLVVNGNLYKLSVIGSSGDTNNLQQNSSYFIQPSTVMTSKPTFSDYSNITSFLLSNSTIDPNIIKTTLKVNSWSDYTSNPRVNSGANVWEVNVGSYEIVCKDSAKQLNDC